MITKCYEREKSRVRRLVGTIYARSVLATAQKFGVVFDSDCDFDKRNFIPFLDPSFEPMNAWSPEQFAEDLTIRLTNRIIHTDRRFDFDGVDGPSDSKFVVISWAQDKNRQPRFCAGPIEVHTKKCDLRVIAFLPLDNGTVKFFHFVIPQEKVPKRRLKITFNSITNDPSSPKYEPYLVTLEQFYELGAQR